MATATLQEVVGKCIADQQFFKRLIENTDQALQQGGLELAAADRSALDRMLSNVDYADIAHIVGIVDKIRVLNKDDWQPGWPMGWVPFLGGRAGR